MAGIKRDSQWSHLFFIPSVYGGLTWGGALFLYQLRLIEWESASIYAIAIFVIVECVFIMSVIIFSPLYRNWIARRSSNCNSKSNPYNTQFLLLLLHIVGFIGIGKYVKDFSSNFGGLEGFFIALFSQSHLIRWAAEDTFSVGTQISYFGWIAISLTVFEVARKKISRWWLLVAFLQFAVNLMFIDRTRPIWILFTSALIILPTASILKVGKILKWALISTGVGIFVFLGIAAWVGKISEEGIYGTSDLPVPLQTVYSYATSGFPYFNRILDTEETISYTPERTMYPFIKILSSLNLVGAPPSQINEFYYLPFETNVGTFLEPFYRDGGIPFVIIGIIISSFGIDAVGLRLLKNGNNLSLYAWANLCFISFIGFFTPKIGSFPIWLFLGMAFLSGIFNVLINIGKTHTKRVIFSG